MHPRAKKALDSFLREDIGRGDITSNLLPRKKITARIISRNHGVVAGTKYAAYIFSSKKCSVRILRKDGMQVRPDETIMTISGPAYSVLSCERTALNLMSRMSGIATATRSLVRIIKKSSKRTDLYSTRKTAPGLRHFDKEAVETGGGKRHRMTLDQMVMIKDNHLAVAPLGDLLDKARRRYKKFEVEVENLRDAVSAARGGASTIMLDNIPPAGISRIISELERLGLRKQVRIEASGGIDASNIRSYAKTGVDMISLGKITSSVQGLDLSLEV